MPRPHFLTFVVGALIIATPGCVSKLDPRFLSYDDCFIAAAPDPLVADGSSSQLQVSLRYGNGLPSSGLEVMLLASGAPVSVQEGPVVTDDKGLARFDVQANQPGTVTFGVQVSYHGRVFVLPLTTQVPVVDMVPRVPPRNPNVSLYGQISGLAFGTSVAIEVNQRTLPPMGRNGVVVLVGNVPKGTLYDVAIPINPRGQSCSITPKHGAIGPNTPYVQVHCALSVVTANDVNDTVVLGQMDDASSLSQSPPSAATLLRPWGKTFTSVEGVTFVADRSNQRVLGYYPEPVSGSTATLVLGQNNDLTASGPSAGTQGFDGPSAMGGGNEMLLVADTNNNRIVVYEPTPFGQVDPTLVLGQANFAATASGCGPATLNHPNQAATAGNMLLVADSSNHRVLIWSSWPTAMGAPADQVLGQTDLTTCLPNQGSGLAFANSLSAPQDVWADKNYLAVADFGNRRVLVWAHLPVFTGQAADIAVGQADLNSSGLQATSATSLNGPVSVIFDNNTLFVADAQDHRVVAFSPFPIASGPAASYALGQHLATDNTCNQGHGATPFTLCNPTGVSFVGGDLAVTDSNNNRVVIFYSDANAIPQGSFGVVVAPGASFFAPALLSYDAKAGHAATATVSALDYRGQVNAAYLGTVGFVSTDPNAVLPAAYTYTLADAGVHDFNVTFFRAATHALSVYDAQNLGARGSDPSIVVVAGEANAIAVTGFPNNPNVGQQASLLVTAYDAWGNVATDFLGTVILSSSDANAALPPAYTFVSADQGVHAFSASLTTPGNQNISVDANGLAIHAGTQQNILVVPPPRPLGGAVSGLVNGNVIVTNVANGDTISLGNGNYLFDQNVVYGQNYNVVAISPSGQSCTVANGNATMGLYGKFNVMVTCAPRTYSLGGTIQGLLTFAQVLLQNGSDTMWAPNGNFAFPTGVAYNSNFAVSLTNPNGQTCAFAGNSNAGVMPAANDYNIAVNCSANAYSLGGTILGLLANTNVTLSDGNDTISRTNSAYTFPTLLPYASAYSIGITNPAGQSCTFNPNTAGNGNMPAAPVTNANVVCSTNTYPLGGSVTGLVTSNITLTNTVNGNVISVGNGNYVFNGNVPYAGNYNVTASSPNGLNCSVTNGNAVMAVGGEFNVWVACTPKSYILGGTVAGLLSNTNLTLVNGGDTIPTGNGNFAFPTGVAYNSNFAASLTQPVGQTCGFVGNSNAGVMPAGNDSNLVVSCATNTYALGGRISGLLNNTNVILANGNDTLSYANGSYTFPTAVPYNSPYNISIANPFGQSCVFSPNSIGGGTMGPSPTLNANVACQTDSNSTRYLMSAFVGTSISNLSVYASADAATFSTLDFNIYAPPIGSIIRNPSVMRHTNGFYYVAYTSNLTGSLFSLAQSRDLLNWSFVTNVDMNAISSENVTAVRGPEWFRDELTNKIYILVSTQVSNNVDDCGGMRFTPHLLSASDTSPTTTFSGWSDVGLSATTAGGASKFSESLTSSNYINGQIVRLASTYHLFIKNEMTKYIEHGTSSAVSGSYAFSGGEGDWASWQGASTSDGCPATQRAPLYLDSPSFMAQGPKQIVSMYLSAYSVNKYYMSTITSNSNWTALAELGNGLSGTIGDATVIDAYASPFNVGLVTDSDNNNSFGYPDWDSGYIKHMCRPGQAVAGISKNAGNTSHHAKLCKMPVAPLDPNLALTQGDTLSAETGTSSLVARVGDYDVNYYKAECGMTEYVVGVSNTVSDNQHVHAIRCAESGQTIAKNCVAHIATSVDDRANFSTLDWDLGYVKAECGGDQVAVGISVDTSQFRLHSILCCSR